MTQFPRRSTVPGVLLLLILLAFTPNHSRAQEEGTRKVLTKITPTYPEVAHKMEIQGSVKVEAVVSPNGSVKSVAVKGGHPVLAQAAENAVRGWKWEPSSKETRELIEIRFNRQ